jgi:molecular chaperone DnaK (HSP70)
MKEATNTKEILSANKATVVKVAELLDDITLKFELTREEFEDASAHLLARAMGPVESALRKSRLNKEDIH